MKKLDLDALGAFHAVRYERNGETRLLLVDGQHRQAALIKVGLGEWEVDVMVHTDVVDDAGAAQLFLDLQSRLGVSPYDKYNNEVRANDPIATGVDEIVRERHLVVSKTAGEGILMCPVSLKRCFKLDEGRALRVTLDILEGAFGRIPSALEGKLIEGMSIVMAANNGAVDCGVMIGKLAKYPGHASGLIGDARGFMKFHRQMSLAASVAHIVVNTYNVNRRSDRIKL